MTINRTPKANWLAIYLLIICSSFCQADDSPYGGHDIAKLLERDGPASGTWISLFNGKNLDGWIPKIRNYPTGENFGHTFRVANGHLHVAYDDYEKFDSRFGHLFYHRPYSHYILSLEYRFVGNQARGGPGWAFENSGVMLHSQSPESMGLKQDFPLSIEVQLLGGTDTKSRPSANVCTPGTHIEMAGKLRKDHCIDSESETFPGEQWVQLNVIVLGNTLIEHRLNGDIVLSYQQPQIGGGNISGHDKAQKIDGKMLSDGYISLQSESHPVEFRRVELLDLSTL